MLLAIIFFYLLIGTLYTFVYINPNKVFGKDSIYSSQFIHFITFCSITLWFFIILVRIIQYFKNK